MVAWILNNKVPNGDLVNKQENRAISVKNYMTLLKSERGWVIIAKSFDAQPKPTGR